MSSRRRIRRKGCERKRRHSTPEAARLAISVMAHTHSLYRPGLQVYHCGNCGGYHVGHQRRRAA